MNKKTNTNKQRDIEDNGKMVVVVKSDKEINDTRNWNKIKIRKQV